MLQGVRITLGLSSTQYWMKQIPITQGVATPEDATLIFSGSQGFLVLIAGLVLAFAFQLLLTNFFIALGISYLDSDNHSDADFDDQESGDLDDTIDRVGVTVGLRALGTASITLFIACFLAVKLCPVNDAVIGAILGLVIWAAYFSLLVWVSATTVGTAIGSVVNKATSGLQGIVGTATVALGAKTVSDQVVSTAEAAAATVRRELSIAVDTSSIRKAIDNYLKKLQLPEADRQEIQDEFEKLVADPEMKSIARNNHLSNIRRQTFVDLVNSRTEFSKQDVNQFLDQLEGGWQLLWGQQPQKASEDNRLLNYLQSAQPEELKSSQLTTKLEQLIEQTRKHQAKQQAEAAQKVAETAAWWLFGTAFAAAIASAFAGAISVRV